MIHWPCVLKLDGDDELIYLASMSELLSECSGLILTPADQVIDSAGFVYSIACSAADVTLIKGHVQLSAADVSRLIQSHEFCKAEVCLTKIQFDSVSDAILCLKPSAK